MEIAACQHMAVPAEVMQHIVNVESGYNPYAIGVVGGQLVRQPQNIGEAVATVQMLESKGYNFSLGLAQVNRSNLSKYGLTSYQQAFDICPNLTAGARILSECYASSGNDWGKSFSCYYSGNFVTGYQDGYVQKVFDSINRGSQLAAANGAVTAIPLQISQNTSPRGASKLPVPTVAADSAVYRVAIRSTLLDTAAGMATAPLAAALASKVSPPATDAQTAASAAATTPPGISPTATPAQVPATGNPAAADVFVPQVSSLGDPPHAAVGADAATATATASAPSTPVADRADLRQGNRDDAFVF